jgi:hypothetical protein
MNKVLQFFLVITLFAIPYLASSQVNLKMAEVPGETGTWGVFVKVCESNTPSGNTITGSGQITFKFPAGSTVSNLISHSGTWSQNATVVNPNEAYGFTYVSMGFLVDNPQIMYYNDTETLLFSFKLNGNTTGEPELIKNGMDPFDDLPNSVNSNPGNELTVLDFGVQPMGLYTYSGNYEGNASNCEAEPQDTTVIIDPIDTTGNNDTTVIDTTGSGDTTVIDTTGNGDTTVIDTTGNGDTTEQTSGVFDIKKQAAYFTLYPIPSYEWVTVKFINPEPAGGTLKLFAMNGKSIRTIQRGQNMEVKFDVSGLSGGLYLIRYEKDGKTLQNQKFLKQ